MIVRLCGAVLGAVLLAVLPTAGPAAAHITVDPRNAVQGGYATVVFRVPNERPETDITEVEISFPEANPVPGVRTKPVPGWRVKATQRKVSPPIDVPGQKVDTVVSRLTWTPTSKRDAIQPAQFQEFPVSMGPLPKTSTLVFESTQKYSDGEVVHWFDQRTGGTEPEHPAPVLNLAKAPAPDGAATDVGNGATAGANRNSGDTPLWLSILTLVAGLAALAIAVLAYLRTRRDGRRYVDDEYDDEDEYDEEADLEDAEVGEADLAEEAGLERDEDSPIRRPSPRPR